MIRPYLVDKGYDMKEIGFLMGIVGTSVSFVMAWFSGVLIRRIGIHKARIIVAAMIILAPTYFLATTFMEYNKVAFLIGLIVSPGLLWFGNCRSLHYFHAMCPTRKRRNWLHHTDRYQPSDGSARSRIGRKHCPPHRLSRSLHCRNSCCHT